MALVFGLATPVLGGGVAAAVDLNTWYSAKVQLQVAADGAALAAARELQLPTSTDGQITRVAEAYVADAMGRSGTKPTRVAAVTSIKARTVKVEIDAEVSPLFSRVIYDGLHSISVAATARLTAKVPVCVIGLDTRQDGTLSFMKKAKLTAPGCAVYSNSGHSRSIKAEDAAVASSALFCSAGGFSGRKANFAPEPVTDCPALADPLASRAEPSIGGCLATDKVIKKATETLYPGTYCGGLRIEDNAAVTLSPGIYVIKDGPLIVKKKASLQGVNVGLHFAGDKASLLFDKDSVVSLTAPKDGPMAGLLMSEQRAVSSPEPAPTPDPDLVTGIVAALPPLLPTGAPPMREYRIISDEARTLLGTIYLPSGRLMIDSKKAVADRSAYTVIVARRLDLFEGPNLYLNSNYAGTDIPVPDGVGPRGSDTALMQ